MAIETARAGGIGVLDAVHAAADRHAAIDRNLDALIRDGAAADSCRIGLRLTASQARAEQGWLDRLAPHRHWVVLAAWSPAELATLLPAIAAEHREVWLEAGDGAALAAVDAALPFTGWAGCGSECGGLCGGESAFVLAQRLAILDRPFVIRGGIGVATAAAGAVAGARAVVLDDALLMLRESPLPARWRHLLGKLALTDTTRVTVDGRVLRVIDRPEATAARRLKTGDATVPVGWDDINRAAWPIGETAGRAAEYAARFRSVRAIVNAVHASIATSPAIANAARPLAEGAPLARALNTRVPIVQGPMTRVSDTENFAAAVADGGALPVIALAMMTGDQAATLLSAIARRLADRSWGVGVLGFAPDEIRLAQLDAVRHVRPPFAVLAGGRPDQAAQLEAEGIRTFVHVPAALLPTYMDHGVRRFIFEGGECGGHTGPLHSFSLWDYAVSRLADETAPPGAELQVVFAGGIHDALSSAMSAAIAAPLLERGASFGVLLGTAYLFTQEAVDAGAITPAFQHEALASAATATIETGPGHIIRCARTPFVDTFNREKHALIARGVTGSALSDELDRLVMGRLRIASKGLVRRGDRLEPLDAAAQREGGLYMLGEVAALTERTTTIRALHETIAAGGTRQLEPFPSEPAARVAPPAPADVAIIGMACLVPGADDPATFWRNVLDLRPAIGEIPQERWDHRLFYDPRVGARDRITSKWGGFVDPIPLDPISFGIPPNSLKAITPPQLLALDIARRALIDAGYDQGRPPDTVRERTATVFAVGNTADLEQMYMTRAALPLIVGPVDESVLRRLPEWTEESYPGLLANVTAGRVANRLDLRGPNLSVDAACASGLSALDIAVREVMDGRSDLALAGGFDFEMSPQAYMGFSHTRALSPRGRADVFDRGADGIVIAEGGVVLVLKRLADAVRDGDRIYAVIKGVAASSDGRGLSMTAPKSAGQELALNRAYTRAGFAPSAIGLYEAHGTGTALGDAAEAATLARVLQRAGAASGACAVGSVKSLIGHTRIAAGLVAVMKVALALHHRVKPAHAGVTQPLPELGGGTPLALLADATPWLDAEAPRRAGASAFGFGGTNYHAVLEEHRDPIDGAAPGASAWPVELFVVAAADAAGLRRALERLDRAAAWLESIPAGTNAGAALRDLAFVAATETTGGAFRAAIVAGNAATLRAGIAAALSGTEKATVRIGHGDAAGPIGFLFPGQGSQHTGMGRSAALYFREIGQALQQAAVHCDQPLPDIVWPPAAFDSARQREQQRRLDDTAVAQPAIAAICCGMLDFATTRLGWRPVALAGHSFGEFVALHAAGAMSRDALLALAAARGRAMAAVPEPAGAMAMIGADAAKVSRLIEPNDEVVIANHNAPAQVVISGARDGVAATVDRAIAAGYQTMVLPVSGAFHSPLMSPARDTLARAIDTVAMVAPAVPVYANANGEPYPADPAHVARQLRAHLEQPVNFVAQIEAMYASGVRTFVEVGPGRVLTGLVRRILGDRPFIARALDGDVPALFESIAALFAAGHPTDVAALFDGRGCRWIDLDRLPAVPPRPEWWIDGARVWRDGALTRPAAVDPFLTAETAPLAASSLLMAPDTPLPPPGAGTPLVEFYREYEQTMRHFLQQQERMLGHVLGLPPADAAPAAPAPALAAAAPAPAPPTPIKSDATSSDALLDRLVEITADRTGYTSDAIGPSLDLEGELGIDSIKRIDIVATFVSSLADRDRTLLQHELDRLTRLRTLRAVADASARALAGPSPRAAEASASRGQRFVTAIEPAPPPSSPKRELTGLHLITRDAIGVCDIVARELRERGATVEILDAETLASQTALSARLDAVRARAGAVRGALHLAALGRHSLDGTSSWWPEVEATTVTLFRVLRQLSNELGGTGGVTLAATALGGRWGRDAFRPGAELAAGVHGMLRSFAREYPECATLVVDLNDNDPPWEQARAVLQEYLSPSDSEVGYRGGQRYRGAVAAAAADAAAAAPWRPEAGWVVLATGGTRGIVAQVCAALAAPGVRFILIGRGGSDRFSEERGRALQALRGAGAEAEVLHVDAADAAAFGAAIDDIYRRYGRIDAVLHGAGVIDDQRLERKTEASFPPIFGAKVGGAWTLAQRLRPEHLKWVLLFGSVSGRFGNPGQTDYAAANEVLNRIAWRLSREWPRARVAAINWGPWRGAGMMSDSTLALVEARGLQPFDLETGRQFVIDELRGGGAAPEVIAGDGPWSAQPVAAARTRQD